MGHYALDWYARIYSDLSVLYFWTLIGFIIFEISNVSWTLRNFSLYLKDWGAQWGVWVCGGVCMLEDKLRRTMRNIRSATTGRCNEEIKMMFSAIEKSGELWLLKTPPRECVGVCMSVCACVCSSKGAEAMRLKRGFEASPTPPTRTVSVSVPEFPLPALWQDTWEARCPSWTLVKFFHCGCRVSCL